MSRIEGKVAAVLSATSLAINRGSDQGVEIGMRFKVLNRRGLGITDPDTGELLGDAEAVKTEVKIIEVGPRLATARTFRTFQEDTSPATWILSRRVLETLKVDDDVADESTIRVGDPVIQVIEQQENRS
ncbi:hypothetical protein [Streptomyces shenzhenensis]|uniref:hypothetical protein n=1 Tax=Streptomyces shenzhenensis TaxID=943815 RepID=UPI0015F09397|nr:hypothetical protein [Streptomyces shenzhenensis]